MLLFLKEKPLWIIHVTLWDPSVGSQTDCVTSHTGSLERLIRFIFFKEKGVCSHRLGLHLEVVWHSRDPAVDQNSCCWETCKGPINSVFLGSICTCTAQCSFRWLSAKRNLVSASRDCSAAKHRKWGACFKSRLLIWTLNAYASMFPLKQNS